MDRTSIKRLCACADLPDHSFGISSPSLPRGNSFGHQERNAFSAQDHTVVLYKDETLWKQRLAVSDDERAYLFVLGPNGHIRWTNSSAFADAAYERLRATVLMLEQGQLRVAAVARSREQAHPGTSL